MFSGFPQFMDSEKAICSLGGVGWSCFTNNTGHCCPLLPSFFSTDHSALLAGCWASLCCCLASGPTEGLCQGYSPLPVPSSIPLNSYVSSPSPSREPSSACHRQPCQQSSWDPSDPALASSFQPDPHSPQGESSGMASYTTQVPWLSPFQIRLLSLAFLLNIFPLHPASWLSVLPAIFQNPQPKL